MALRLKLLLLLAAVGTTTTAQTRLSTENHGNTAHTAARHVHTGAEKLAQSKYAVLRGRRVGVIANPTAILYNLTHIVDAMAASPDVDVVCVFGPEHGFRGDHQDSHGGGNYIDNRTKLPVYDTYGKNHEELVPILKQAGIDTLVFDIQDVGARFYTFVWTMWDCMQASIDAGITKFVVLDRPNPIGGVHVQGPVLEPAYASFIGGLPIALRHGMTVGELATMFHAEFLPGANKLNLTVITMEGWTRDQLFDQTGLPWVAPSPNMPTLDTALVYPGMGIIEGTELSEGRGTTRPFEFCGAPYLSWQFAANLTDLRLAGVSFREMYFIPMFSKFAGNTTAGIQLYVEDKDLFNPVTAALHVVAEALKHPEFRWLGDGSDFDLHLGNNSTRLGLMRGDPVDHIQNQWLPGLEAFKVLRDKYLLYSSANH